MPVYRGKKKAGRHSTLISEAYQMVQLLQRVPEVKKISPGIIRPGGKREKASVKVWVDPSGLLVTVRGTSSVQEIRVYTSSSLVVQKHIEEMFI